MQDAEKKIEQALWIAHTLLQRRMATGSTANISFRVNEDVYISGSGTCFGTLRKEEFAKISLTGESKNAKETCRNGKDRTCRRMDFQIPNRFPQTLRTSGKAGEGHHPISLEGIAKRH